MVVCCECGCVVLSKIAIASIYARIPHFGRIMKFILVERGRLEMRHVLLLLLFACKLRFEDSTQTRMTNAVVGIAVNGIVEGISQSRISIFICILDLGGLDDGVVVVVH